MKPWRKQFGIWVPGRSLSDERGFINAGAVGAIAGSRRRSTSTVEVGVTTVGGSSGSLSANILFALTSFTAPAGGNITEFLLYSANSSSGQDVKVGLYADSSGAPGALIAAATAFTDTGTWTASWKSFGGMSIPVTNGNVYWLAINVSVDSAITYYYDAATNYTKYKLYNYSNAFADPFGSYTNHSQKISMKAILTP